MIGASNTLPANTWDRFNSSVKEFLLSQSSGENLTSLGRNICTKRHTVTLLKYFDNNNRPDRMQIEAFSKKTGMTHYQIRNWFCNKRQELKRTVLRYTEEIERFLNVSNSPSSLVSNYPFSSKLKSETDEESPLLAQYLARMKIG